MNEPGGIPDQNIPVVTLLALTAARSFGSPEETCAGTGVPNQGSIVALSADNSLYSLVLSLFLFVGAVWPCRSLCQPGL